MRHGFHHTQPDGSEGYEVHSCVRFSQNCEDCLTEACERMTYGGVGRLTDTATVHEHSMWSDFWSVAWVVMGPVTYAYAAR